MEVLAVLIIGIVLAIPVIAIVALVRSGETRRLLDEALKDSNERASNLSREIVTLRHEVEELSKRPVQPAASPSPAPQAAPRRRPFHAPQPSVAPFEAPRQSPHPAAPTSAPDLAAIPPFAAHAASPAPPQHSFAQATSTPVTPEAKSEPISRPPADPAPMPPLPPPPLHSAAFSERIMDAPPAPALPPRTCPQPPPTRFAAP